MSINTNQNSKPIHPEKFNNHNAIGTACQNINHTQARETKNTKYKHYEHIPQETKRLTKKYSYVDES